MHALSFRLSEAQAERMEKSNCKARSACTPLLSVADAPRFLRSALRAPVEMTKWRKFVEITKGGKLRQNDKSGESTRSTYTPLSFRLSEALGRLTRPVISSAAEKSNRIVWSIPFCPSLTLRDFSAPLVAANCALSKPCKRGLQLQRSGRNDKRGKPGRQRAYGVSEACTNSAVISK